MTRLVIFSALLALNISVLSTRASATDSGEGKGALDQITPANVSGPKEVCEIQLNEPIWF
jgi:hypothetical protein